MENGRPQGHPIRLALALGHWIFLVGLLDIEMLMGLKMHSKGFDARDRVTYRMRNPMCNIMAAGDVHGSPQLNPRNTEPEQAGLTQLDFRNLHNTRGFLGDSRDTGGPAQDRDLHQATKERQYGHA